MEGQLRIQSFRTNDLVNNGGKQFELGRAWCRDFFSIDDTVKEFTVHLTFKALSERFLPLDGKHIELKISGVNKRGDRKAYSNSENGMSQIKDFFINDLHLTVEENLEDYFALYKINDTECYLYYVSHLLYDNFLKLFENDRPIVSIAKRNLEKRAIEESLQQITYGAPGTGKSYGLKDVIDSVAHFRTTFHPDSDYASFVGAYKPSMSKVIISNNYAVLDEGNKVEEEQITYKFVPQAFINAYVSAWKNYRAEEPTILVIEEINRGNCAQIFGDLFQLLDREGNGFSSYPIEADSDVAHYLQGVMPDVTKYGKEIDELFIKSYPEGITSKIKSGELLLLPNNLYIWATMNTSDQSLFPIDSAFKRRWDWKFVKIADAHKGWFIQFGCEGCDWWTFIYKMNKLIAKETSSDDKKMGYFFCKPQSEDEKVITEDQFVGKVLFYLWNDVFKDGNTALFKVSGEEPTFDSFYNDDNTPSVVAIRNFLIKVVGIDNIFEIDYNEGLQNSDMSNDSEGNKVSIRDYTKYTINGGSKIGKNRIAQECVKEYIKLNPSLTLEQVIDEWKSIDFDASHFIESEEEFSARKDKAAKNKCSDKVPCNDGYIYVANNVYNKNNIVKLINAINSKKWGIDIKKCD